MDGKKISFGFAKVNKKQTLQAGPAASVPLKNKDDSIQMIECLEGQSIKVIGNTDEPPPLLVIPLREQDKTTVPDRLAKLLGIRQEKQGRLQVESIHPPRGKTTNGSADSDSGAVTVKLEPNSDSVVVPTEETLEQRAAREILNDIDQANVKLEEQNNFVVPLLPEELPLDGARESTMDDYESVPIEKFGLAMLRGMGYKDDPKKDTAKPYGPDFGPVMRPKGLGLGADRAMKAKAANAPLIPPAQGEILTMKRGAQIKVLAGKHQDAYGTDESPTKIVLLDWQCMRYVSPVIDLVYFIFCCTDEHFRRRHYEEMMNIYHQSLSVLLEKLGHNAQEVFPRTALTDQLRQFGCFGLMMAVFLVPLLGIRNEDLPEMEETAEKFRDEQHVDFTVFTKNTNQSAYRQRMSAVIRDAVRYGYL